MPGRVEAKSLLQRKRNSGKDKRVKQYYHGREPNTPLGILRTAGGPVPGACTRSEAAWTTAIGAQHKLCLCLSTLVAHTCQRSLSARRPHRGRPPTETVLEVGSRGWGLSSRRWGSGEEAAAVVGCSRPSPTSLQVPSHPLLTGTHVRRLGRAQGLCLKPCPVGFPTLPRWPGAERQ